ncbi:pathogen-related protein-like [Oryza glaberrima]|uniref:Pathogen-related protein n=1 Tax=Oryza glaberrima TaxID=4538 RepID=I1NRF4_ORYGL|nr:pathogen-related protein-like [Oryza glaberrima]
MAAADSSGGDKYRSHLAGDGEKNTVWRHGAPPTFDTVNSLFEAERTQEWPAGSLEETVQNAIKTWEMELSHKARLQDFKSVSPGLFRLSVNGGRPLTGEETLAVGSYNALLASPILPGAGAYDAAAETFESSHDLFRAAFPRGFAWEVIRVYSGPPVITFKFRHWGHMDGPYKGHAPTGDKVEFYGVAVLKVDEQLRAEDVEVYYDPGELLGDLLKGPLLVPSVEKDAARQLGERLGEVATLSASGADSQAQSCPFLASGKREV